MTFSITSVDFPIFPMNKLVSLSHGAGLGLSGKLIGFPHRTMERAPTNEPRREWLIYFQVRLNGGTDK